LYPIVRLCSKSQDLTLLYIHASVANETWRHAEELARALLSRIVAATGFSRRFEPCIAALENHIETASVKIRRLG